MFKVVYPPKFGKIQFSLLLLAILVTFGVVSRLPFDSHGTNEQSQDHVVTSNPLVRDRERSTRASLCDKTLERARHFSKSQDKEDQLLFESYFKRLCGGTYVELGGLDGVRFSNSHLFHHGLGWNGVLIEPNPKSFAELRKNRPDDDNFNVAICSEPSEVTFIDSGEGAVSGIREFMAPSFIAMFHKSEHQEATRIKCEPLTSVIEKSSLETSSQVIDFLSLDVEGAEFEVLKTLDFDRIEFGVIFYEADSHNPLKNEAIVTFLEEHGYVFRKHMLRSNFHVNVRFHRIYSALYDKSI